MWRLTPVLLLQLSVASTAMATRVAVIRPYGGRADEVLHGVVEALRQMELEAVPAGQTLRRLTSDAASQLARQRVSEAVRQARTLRRDMLYEKATQTLMAADRDAIDGLLRFVAPQLAARLHLERGLLLLPTSPGDARRELRESYIVFPRRVSEGGHSPKIIAELRHAAAAAQQARRPEVASEAEATRASDVLGVEYLIVPAIADNQLEIALFSVKKRSWRRLRRPASQIASSVRELFGLPRVAASPPPSPPAATDPVEPGPSEQHQQKRPSWPWIALGAGAAAAVVGATLWAISNDRVSEAEELAGRDPLVEYAADAEPLESSARRFRAMAIVSLVTAGAATAAAVIGWLKYRRSQKRERVSAAGVAIDGRGVVVTFR